MSSLRAFAAAPARVTNQGRPHPFGERRTALDEGIVTVGLDTSHDAWHGAYSAFTRWRNQLAEAAGYAVWPVDLHGGYTSPTVMIDWGHITDANLQGEWDKTPADPLIVLIAHSDCDGYIHPAQAAALADRIEELMPLLPAEPAAGHIGDWQAKTQRFIDGLRQAVAAGEAVGFA